MVDDDNGFYGGFYDKNDSFDKPNIPVKEQHRQMTLQGQ